jgi:predicted hydrocarbon binding protein
LRAVAMSQPTMSPPPIDLTASSLVAVSRTALSALRAALLRDAGPAAASYFQEAGYAGGAAVFEAFRAWLRERGHETPDALGVDEFAARASEFFHDLGWGSLRLGALRDTVATLDSTDWSEAEVAGGLDQPACHLSTGMFADFFGRIADAPLAVMEVECRSAGDARCRFLLGSAEVMERLYESMAQGKAYGAAVEAI